MTIVLSPPTHLGCQFYFYPQDREIGERIALGKFEPYLTKLFLKELKAEMKVVDIGANIGYYSILAAKAGCRVLAFEPEKKNFELLLENIKLNKVSEKIRPFNLALGDKRGQLKLNVSFKNFGDHSFFSKKDKVELVRVDTLDNLVGQKIDFIKSDTQGYESRIFAGAINTITKYKPTILYEHWFTNPPELLDYFLYETEEYWQIRRKLKNREVESVNIWATKNPLSFKQRYGDFWLKKYLKQKLNRPKT